MIQYRSAAGRPSAAGANAPAGPLLPLQKADNAEHRREHAFARMKNYEILRDCRYKGNGLHTAVQTVATMHYLAMAA